MLLNIKKILLLLSIFSLSIDAKNFGHRLGGDVYSFENTLDCYTKALKNLQHKKNFKYVEFDIRETKDGKIVLFHDNDITRLIPQTKHNIKVLKRVLKRKKFEKIRIKDLTFKEVKGLWIEKNIHIPTLKEVLDTSIKWNLTKPMHIEVKSLNTDMVRYKLIELINEYSSKLDISIIAFRKNFNKSFPFTPRWIKLFQNNGIEAYQIDKYSFTDKQSFCLTTSNFTTLLTESKFSIRKKEKRSQAFTFVLPKKIKCKNTVQIGIFGGADDSGDKGITFTLIDKNGKQFLSGFSNSTSWEWFSLNPQESREFTLSIIDMDTKLKGKHPGNGGMVKVLYSM